jgi:hypothetical protein
VGLLCHRTFFEEYVPSAVCHVVWFFCWPSPDCLVSSRTVHPPPPIPHHTLYFSHFFTSAMVHERETPCDVEGLHSRVNGPNLVLLLCRNICVLCSLKPVYFTNGL